METFDLAGVIKKVFFFLDNILFSWLQLIEYIVLNIIYRSLNPVL